MYFIRAIWFNVLGIGALLLLCAYAGLVVYAYYDIHGCDPIKMKVSKMKKSRYIPSILCMLQILGLVSLRTLF